MTDARTLRIAENEVRFRDINHRLADDLRRLPVDGKPVEFVCECGNAACSEQVLVGLPEFEVIRRDPRLFFVVPGHELPDVEEVVERTSRYTLVRKPVEVLETVGAA